MKLKKLLKNLPDHEVKGPKEVEITGICANSKFIAPGNLFVAKKGKTVDGTLFIAEAVSGGASALLTDMYDPSLKEIAQIIHPDIPMMEGLLAAEYNLHPYQDLLMVALTGTNGKTATSFLIKHLLDSTYGPCGVIGTIEYIMGSQRYQATHTTPDVSVNHKLLREMVQHSCRSAVMEVTSHALDQGRVRNIDFDVAVFTNLSPEHLDYHETMEAYCQAKSRIFRDINPKTKKKQYPKAAIVNSDDPYCAQIVAECRVPVITYGIKNTADLQAIDIELCPAGTKYNLLYQGLALPIKIPLIGRFNVYNSLAAIACALSQKIPLETIAEAARTFPSVPGRLEPIPNKRGYKVYVDFAHTEDALENVLQCLTELNKGGIITVFGCGGDRDQQKRPKMAAVAEKYSKLTIVTSDNPRSEEPMAIIFDIVQGFQRQESYLVEPDRRTAIETAISQTAKNDLVLIAGRGHEPYQIFAHHTLEFNDREVTAEILR